MARALVDERLAAVDHLRAANRSDPQKLHDLRLAVKAARDAIELFAPVLGPRRCAHLDSLRELQTSLGAVHDLDVLLATIEVELPELKLTDADREASLAYLRIAIAERREAVLRADDSPPAPPASHQTTPPR